MRLVDKSQNADRDTGGALDGLPAYDRRDTAMLIQEIRRREVRRREAMSNFGNFDDKRIEEIRTHWLVVEAAQRQIAAIPAIDEFLPVLRAVYPEIFNELAEVWPQRLVDATTNGVSLENFRQLADKWVADYTDAIRRVQGKRANDGRGK